jgi:hypothetical protein
MNKEEIEDFEEAEQLIDRHKVEDKKQQITDLAEKIMLVAISNKHTSVLNDTSIVTASFMLAKVFVERKEKLLNDN